VQTELATVQALAAAHKAESESLKNQFEAVQSKIRALNDNELQITELSRKADLLEESYMKYAANREQARIDAALETGRVSNVNVVQPATYVAKPSSPLVKLTLALGFVLALVGAALTALVAEAFSRSLRSPEQIENELGIPVLFSVPRGSRHELVKN
jgi:succinoglycan biosynthesis transport protein ExoP